ncbi:MAG: alpha/beta fold hydrolase [Acidimicrobiales bacterium]
MTVALVVALAAAACGKDEPRPSTSSTSTPAVAANTTVPPLPNPQSNPAYSVPTDPFYVPPSPLPEGMPGQIIRSEPMAGAPEGSTAYKILYHSTSVSGQDVAVSGFVLVPGGDAPPGGRPVVTWAHPTTGVVDTCAPSLSPLGFSLVGGLAGLLQAGYVVAATDYEGLGTPGVHPYLVGDSEGRATLDAARAAANLSEAAASKNVAVWGWSQGGQGALFAGQLAPTYAPDLRIVGVAAAAPAGELSQLLTDDLNTFDGVELGAYALNAYQFVYQSAHPGLDADALLTPAGQQGMPQIVKLCNLTQATEMEAVATPLVGKFFAQNPSSVPPWPDLLAANTPGGFPTSAPVYLAQGSADTLVIPSTTATLAQNLCRLGDTVTFKEYDGAVHTNIAFVAADDVVTWIGQRFAGQPAASTCSS